MTLKVPASERILRRIQDVDDKLQRIGESTAAEKASRESLQKVRRAYVADLIDVLNEEESHKPRVERVSYSLTTTEAWISAHSKSPVTI